MSHFLYGRIVRSNISPTLNAELTFSMVLFATENNFAIQFFDTLPSKDTKKDINFAISDYALISYCEYFLEPILWDEDGKPMIEDLLTDLKKIKKLIATIFTFDFVSKIELRFSDGEADEEDYKVVKTSLKEMRRAILEEYLSAYDFPCINVVIER